MWYSKSPVNTHGKQNLLKKGQEGTNHIYLLSIFCIHGAMKRHITVRKEPESSTGRQEGYRTWAGQNEGWA